MAGKMKNRFLADENVLAKLPIKLVKQLMPFQKEGVRFAIYKKGKCLIADEMGLGKTLQAISVSYYYREEWPLLIIVPSALKYCWIEELEKWLPDLHPHEINLIASGQDAGAIASSKITIATFGLLSKQSSHIIKEALQNQHFHVVIVDESHFIKNRKTASCKAVMPLVQNAARRILLSGTPALARPVELYPQLEALCPGEFGSWTSFTDRYCDARFEYFGRMKRRNVKGASNLEELQEKLNEKVMIRREKSEVLTQLPPKQRQRVLFDLKDSSFKKEIRESFEELRKLLKGDLNFLLKITESTSSDEPNHIQRLTPLSLIQKLYKLSGEAKIGPAREYIEMLCENVNLKFLIFAYHHCMMNGIQQTLWDKKVKFIRIDGDTKMSERHQLVQQYQSDPDTKVAILSILAAGTGLTFTAAKLVVFAEMYWTPGVMVQCEDRAHRIGQTGCVAVHYLVAKGTMDEWVWSAVCKKTVVTSTALSGHKKNLEADEGDKYQLDILNNADMWVPPSNEDMDLGGYFMSQQPSDQKSILSYFSPSQRLNNSVSMFSNSPDHSSSGKRLRELQEDVDRPKKKRNLEENVVVLIDSSDGEDVFASSSSKKRKKASKCNKKTKGMKAQELDDTGSDRLDFDIEHSFEKDKKCDTPNQNSNPKEIFDFSKDSYDCDLPRLAVSSRKRRKQPHEDQKSQSSLEQSPNVLAGHRSPDDKKIHSIICSETKSVDKTPGNQRGYLLAGSSKQSVMNLSKENKSGNSLKISNWSCHMCTFCNHGEIPYCEMCDTPKKDKFHRNLSNSQILNASFSSTHIETKNSADNKLPLCDNKSSQMEISERNDSSSEHMPDSHSTINPSHSVSDVTVSESEEECCLHSDASTDSEHEEDGSDSEYELSCKGSESLLSQFDGNSAEESDAQSHSNDDKDELVVGSCSERSNTTEGGEPCQEFDDDITVDDLENIDVLERTQIQDQENVPAEEKRVVNIDDLPVYDDFLYCCSKHTGRIYLFNTAGNSLDGNFLPLDVEIGNTDSLPDFLLHPKNLKVVQKFVREWNSLTETKRRLIIKHSELFLSPLRTYEELRHKQTSSTDRHRTKESLTAAASIKAQEINGTVRHVRRADRNASDLINTNFHMDSSELTVKEGVAQTLDAEGVPLCINCQKPYTNTLLSKSTITSSENSWQTRFCSPTCMDSHWMKTNSDYIREKVYEAERGVCQICGIDAHCTYKQIRDALDMKKRADLLNKTKFKTLKAKQKEVMVKKPVPGQFWHADHIKPVWEGGGQCDIDNLRTLCVMCHQSVTAKQAHKRAVVRRLSNAVGSGNIKAFFQPV